jgi:hypothetical protein
MSRVDQLLDELASESRLSKAEIIEILAQVHREEDAKRDADAEKWRALMACGRITYMGSAGVGGKASRRYAHITINFWTNPAEVDGWRDDQDRRGRECFSQFVEIAVENYRK